MPRGRAARRRSSWPDRRADRPARAAPLRSPALRPAAVARRRPAARPVPERRPPPGARCRSVGPAPARRPAPRREEGMGPSKATLGGETVEMRDQRLRAAPGEHAREIRAPRRDLADRIAIEDVDDLPRPADLTQAIADRDIRLA